MLLLLGPSLTLASDRDGCCLGFLLWQSGKKNQTLLESSSGHPRSGPLFGDVPLPFSSVTLTKAVGRQCPKLSTTVTCLKFSVNAIKVRGYSHCIEIPYFFSFSNQNHQKAQQWGLLSHCLTDHRENAWNYIGKTLMLLHKI